MSAGLETYAVRQAEQGLHAFVHWGGTQVRHGPGAYTTGLHVDLGNLMDQGFRGAMCRVVWAPTAEWHKNQSVSKTVYKRHSAAARPERGGGGGGASARRLRHRGLDLWRQAGEEDFKAAWGRVYAVVELRAVRGVDVGPAGGELHPVLHAGGQRRAATWWADGRQDGGAARSTFSR